MKICVNSKKPKPAEVTCYSKEYTCLGSRWSSHSALCALQGPFLFTLAVTTLGQMLQRASEMPGKKTTRNHKSYIWVERKYLKRVDWTGLEINAAPHKERCLSWTGIFNYSLASSYTYKLSFINQMLNVPMEYQTTVETVVTIKQQLST